MLEDADIVDDTVGDAYSIKEALRNANSAMDGVDSIDEVGTMLGISLVEREALQTCLSNADVLAIGHVFCDFVVLIVWKR